MIFFIGYAVLIGWFCVIGFVHMEIVHQIWHFPRLNNLSFWLITSSYMLLLISALV